MPSFRYRAMTASGTIVTGVLDAPSEPAAIEAIRNLGHYPIAADDDTASTSPGVWWSFLAQTWTSKRQASGRGLGIATQELAVLLKAGLELERALDILTRLDETKTMRADWEKTLACVRDGDAFADALAATATLPKFYVNMVRAGEQSGHLAPALEQLAEYLARAQAVRDAVASALVYPAVLLATAGLAIVVVLVFVLPQFEPLFVDAGKALPVSTQIVIAVGDLLTDWGWLLLLGSIVGLSLFRRALTEKRFRRRWDGMLLRLPLFGALVQKIEVERFARTLGALATNAVPLPQALAITADTMNNTIMSEATHGAATGLREGEYLARYLAGTGVFPALAIDMVHVGEETGQLHIMLERLADLYEREVKHAIDRLMALLIPCLTIFMGALVAGLIASILMAVLSVNDLAM